jgi:tetratricopeptide (TPR) repeat protein
MKIAISLPVILAFTGMTFAAERFDMTIRNDFFAGFSGNKEALDRAMKNSEIVLASNSKHAEALVWHGAGLFFLAGGYFRSGDPQKGVEYATRGQREMDDAVALEPGNIGVRIPRGATLIAAGRGLMERNPEQARLMLQSGLSDYEHAYEMQRSRLEQLGEHRAGELLFGIADVNSRLGNQEKAAEFFDRIATLIPGTVYAKRAALWKKSKSLPLSETQCIGCHTAAVE